MPAAKMQGHAQYMYVKIDQNNGTDDAHSCCYFHQRRGFFKESHLKLASFIMIYLIFRSCMVPGRSREGPGKVHMEGGGGMGVCLYNAEYGMHSVMLCAGKWCSCPIIVKDLPNFQKSNHCLCVCYTLTMHSLHTEQSAEVTFKNNLVNIWEQKQVSQGKKPKCFLNYLW